jgi:hypothetical protein
MGVNKKFVYLLNLTVLNNSVILVSNNQKLYLVLVQNLLKIYAREPQLQSRQRGTPNSQSSQMTHLKLSALNASQLQDLILLKFVENECKGSSTSFQHKRKNKLASQSDDSFETQHTEY